jgi:RimJ/RimL family protein N-acetyltransferase
MFQFWADNHAYPHTKEFGIESPNEKSRALLVKLGFIRKTERGEWEWFRCYGVSGM